MLLIFFFTSIQVLLFCREIASSQKFTSEPPSPSVVWENHSITLTWKYTLNGQLGVAQFYNVTGGNSRELIVKKFAGQNSSVEPGFQVRFKADASDTNAWLTIHSVQSSDKGLYELDVSPIGAGKLTSVVQVIVHSPSKFTNVSNDKHTLQEGSRLYLFCEAYGLPSPNITWVRVLQSGSESKVLHKETSWDFLNISSTDAGTYRCKANNGVGNTVFHTITVTVLFAPKIKLQNEYYVGREKSVSLDCQVEGHPPPTIIWTPCNPQENVCDKSRLNISKVQRDAVYNCAVTNNLGRASGNTSLMIGAKKINITLVITSEEKECDGTDTSFWEKLQEAVNNIFTGRNGYDGAKLLNTRCGSLIVDLALKFTSVVPEAWVISTLRDGITDGKLGGFPVNASSIVGIPVIESTATPPTGKTTTKPSKDTNIGLIVGCAVGGFILLVIIIAVVIWCVRKNSNKDKDKKRKSKTSNKEVSDNDAEGHRMAQFQEGRPPSGYGNNGYEDTGSTSRPPAANAGKKDKKGKKKRDEPEKPVGVVYAQVDKSKRTSKPKEPENLYDQAERPNSRRPGELQYVSPEDLHQGHSMPRNSASQPKKPEAYTETQYAVLV